MVFFLVQRHPSKDAMHFISRIAVICTIVLVALNKKPNLFNIFLRHIIGVYTCNIGMYRYIYMQSDQCFVNELMSDVNVFIIAAVRDFKICYFSKHINFYVHILNLPASIESYEKNFGRTSGDLVCKLIDSEAHS